MIRVFYQLKLFSIKTGLVLAGWGMWPGLVKASDREPPENIAEVGNLVGRILDGLFVLLLGVAFLLFLWGLARFILALNQGRQEGVTAGKWLMVWGVLALFVGLSFLTILAIFNYTLFGEGTLFTPLLPE